MNYELKEKSQALAVAFANPAFAEEAKDLKTMDDFIRLMGKYEVELTEEEAREVCATIARQAAQGADGELSEDALEDVSGGVIGWIALGVACVGAFALGFYNA